MLCNTLLLWQFFTVPAGYYLFSLLDSVSLRLIWFYIIFQIIYWEGIVLTILGHEINSRNQIPNVVKMGSLLFKRWWWQSFPELALLVLPCLALLRYSHRRAQSPLPRVPPPCPSRLPCRRQAAGAYYNREYRTALDKNHINFCCYPLDPEDGASRASLYGEPHEP